MDATAVDTVSLGSLGIRTNWGGNKNLTYSRGFSFGLPPTVWRINRLRNCCVKCSWCVQTHSSWIQNSEFWVEGTTINQEGEPGTLLAGSMGTSRAFARFTAKGALLNDASADGGHL